MDTEKLDSFLSQLGKKVVFPAKGILSQAVEAKETEINATIGVALNDDGTLLGLSGVLDQVTLPRKEFIGYPPMQGVLALRELWQEKLFKKNPSLEGEISLPVSTVAISHGLHLAGMLFLDRGDEIILSDFYWENYDLILGDVFGAKLTTYPTFVDKKFNVEGLKQRLKSNSSQRKIVLFNFPNNPVGYTPSDDEFSAIREVLLAEAEEGNQIVVLCDDAYFGLVFDETASKESLFAKGNQQHPNLLYVKLDGATKEDYVWGLRVGFITFGLKGAGREEYLWLEKKVATMVRGSVSMATHLSQSLMLHAYQDPKYDEEKRKNNELLKGRFQEMKRVLESHPEYEELFEMLPCNSGYFASFLSKKGIDIENLRSHLIKKYKVGIIAFDSCFRVAFSSVAETKIATLFDSIYQACCDLSS